MLVRKNDRKSIRRHVRIDCQVVRESDFALVGHRTLDLSPDGMLVRLSDASSLRRPAFGGSADVKVGEKMMVSFQATQLGLWFDTQAEVTRIIRGRRPEDEGRAFGVKFTGMDPVSRLILRGHLRRVPPPLPQRPTRVDYAATIRQIAVA